jgi:hypothetical protein
MPSGQQRPRRPEKKKIAKAAKPPSRQGIFGFLA